MSIRFCLGSLLCFVCLLGCAACSADLPIALSVADVAGADGDVLGAIGETAGSDAADGGQLDAGDVAAEVAGDACAGKNCDDGNPSTDDSCDPAKGCVHLANAVTCEDGSACTIGDVWVGGECKSGGNVLGMNAYAGPSTEYANGLVRTQTGGYALAGATDSKGAGSADAWLIVTDAAGKPLWDKTYGDSAEDYANAIVAMADGGFVLAGSTQSKGNGSYDFWTWRTDATGKVVWEKAWLGPGSDAATSLAVTGDGGVIVAGSSEDSDHADAVLVRYGADGSELWHKSYGGNGYQHASQVVTTADGGFAFVGDTNAEGAGLSDFWLVEVDGNGVMQWHATYGGSYRELGRALAIVAGDGGGFVLTGTIESKPDQWDCWVARVDANGKQMWDATFGGPLRDACFAVAILPDGGFSLTGHKNWSSDINGKGKGYLWLMRLNATGSLLWEHMLVAGWGSAVLADAATGIIAVAGAAYPPNWWPVDEDALLLLTDAFGHTTCATSGVCLSLPLTACDDNNVCTSDSCDASKGCVSTPVAVTTCDDGNACTIDLCDAVTGCMHSAAAVGTVCGDAMACDLASACTASAPAGMVLIPAGTFWMGCNSAKDSNCLSDETPQHKVTLSAYYMDATETTVGHYKACVDAGICSVPKNGGPPELFMAYPGFTDYPVNFVTWTQAQQFCQWRGAGFDLPTEAQWEMAARGNCEKNGSTAGDAGCAAAMRTYPWGEVAPTCSYAIMNDGSGAGCGTGEMWAVGSKMAGDSPYGLHDMAGNVWEWNRDWYNWTYYGSSPATDPYDSANALARVFRGGGYNVVATGLRAAQRPNNPPNAAGENLGFRCTSTYP